MGHSKHARDALGATDLSRDGISHLKTQNIPKVKPHKPSRWMCKSEKNAGVMERLCWKHQNLHFYMEASWWARVKKKKGLLSVSLQIHN